MDIETFREHCLAIEGSTESLPFIDPNVLAFKINGKMFAMCSLNPKDGIFWADMKCNPERSIELREQYNGITAGHVKSTLLWNRIVLDSDVEDKLIVELISHSVDEIMKKFLKKT